MNNELQQLLSSIPRFGEATLLDVKDVDGKPVLGIRRVFEPMAGYKAIHRFGSIESLTDYIGKRATDRSLFLMDERDGVFVVTDSNGTEDIKGGLEACPFIPAHSVQYAAWARYFGNNMNLTGLRELAINRGPEIVECLTIKNEKYDSRSLRRILGALKIDNKTAITSGDTENSVVKTMTVQGKSQDKEYDLPIALVIEVPVFAGEPAQKITLDLDVMDGGGGPICKLTNPHYERQLAEYLAKAMNEVSALANELGFVAGYGRVGYNRPKPARGQ